MPGLEQKKNPKKKHEKKKLLKKNLIHCLIAHERFSFLSIFIIIIIFFIFF